MNKFRSAVAKFNKRLSVKSAAILLSGSMLLASLLGVLRERLLNSAYLPNPEAGVQGYKVALDAFTAAFIVPDFMFMILVSGALSVTFIPVFNARMSKGNKKSAWEIGTSILNLMALVTLVASILMMIFAEPLLKYFIAPGLSESGLALATSMMRVIAVNPFLFAIATVIASMQQALGRFAFYALAPAIYSTGIIIGTLFFTGGINIFGWQVFEGGVMGVALGVVLGAMMQLLVSAIGLIGLGFDYRFKIYWKNKGFKKVLSLLPARSVDQGIDYIVNIAETNLASRMAEGSIRAYNQAITLHMMPINLIGVAISNAAFPSLTERVGSGKTNLFVKEFRQILRVIAWLILPIATIAFFARGYVIHFIVNGGNALYASILGALVVPIVFRSLYHIIARAFYAHQDTKTPLYVSIFAIALNVILAIIFTMQFDWGVYGLAWAQGIVSIVEVVILSIILMKLVPGIFDNKTRTALIRMVIATLLMGIVTYLLVYMMPVRTTDLSFWSVFPKFALITALSFLVYLILSSILRIEEAGPVWRKIKAVMFSKAS